jgi:hypothetical protein
MTLIKINVIMKKIYISNKRTLSFSTDEKQAGKNSNILTRSFLFLFSEGQMKALCQQGKETRQRSECVRACTTHRRLDSQFTHLQDEDGTCCARDLPSC